MRNIIFYFALLLTSQLALADHPSVHGMVLFGEESLFLSHLPMFHKPHDYQTILKIELDKKAKEAYLQSKKGEELFTIVPESFVLPEMVANPKSFKVTIVKGHFERGGVPITSGVVTITKVLYHQSLDPNAIMPSEYLGLLIGTHNESYFLHKITGRPDFDQITKVTLPFNDTQIFNAIEKEGFVPIPVINHDNTLAIEIGDELHTFPPFPRRTYTTLNIEAVIYTEFGDLSF